MQPVRFLFVFILCSLLPFLKCLFIYTILNNLVEKCLDSNKCNSYITLSTKPHGNNQSTAIAKIIITTPKHPPTHSSKSNLNLPMQINLLYEYFHLFISLNLLCHLQMQIYERNEKMTERRSYCKRSIVKSLNRQDRTCEKTMRSYEKLN